MVLDFHRNKASSSPKPFRDNDIVAEKLKEPLTDQWFQDCKADMKPHKHARLALKALHQAGQNKKNIRKILPDISTAIDKISTSKDDKRSEWKNALWRFVSKFSQLDAIDLVRNFEQTLDKSEKTQKHPTSSKRDSEKSGDKHKKVDKSKNKEDEIREREKKEERQREKVKRRQEMAQALQEGKFDAITNRSTKNRNNKKDRFDKNDERKRKFKQNERKYDSFDKFRRQSDPPAAPSMF